MNKLYIVRYSRGDHADFRETDVFVTDKKATATRYVTKFNKLLKKWKEHYKQYESRGSWNSWIKDEYLRYFDRWHSLGQMGECYYNEIEKR